MVKIHKVTKKTAREVAKIEMPLNMNNSWEMALMWYFISWSQKLNKWSRNKRLKYATELGKLSEGIPIHIIDFRQDTKQINNYLKSSKIKLFGYDKGRFVMFDKDKKILSEMTSTKLYSLFAYLIDSLSKGLETHTGFGYVAKAKKIIERDKHGK